MDKKEEKKILHDIEEVFEMNGLKHFIHKQTHGKLSTLLIWHEADPVDNKERIRNNLIYDKYQGNRNPFIDHPEFARMIWGHTF